MKFEMDPRFGVGWKVVSCLSNFQVDNVYLADAAQQLVRTLSYEIPSMKRQINKNNQLREESFSKEEAYIKSSAEMKAQYEKECENLGIKVCSPKSRTISAHGSIFEIVHFKGWTARRDEYLKLFQQGVHVQSELLALLKEMPNVFEEVVSRLNCIQPAIDLYRSFINFTLRQELPDPEFLPLIHYIHSKGWHPRLLSFYIGALYE